MADLTKGPVLPAITGNPQADALIRYGIAIVGAGALGIGVGWAKAHGYKIPDPDTMKLYGQLAGGLILMTWATLWGLKSVRNSQATLVANTVQAAVTGIVPSVIANQMTEKQANSVADPANGASVAAIPTAPIGKGS